MRQDEGPAPPKAPFPMLAVFATILPIFLLLLLGQGLRRLPVFPAEFWRGLDTMGFYVLYPALLFVTIVRADYGALAFKSIAAALAFATIAITVLTLALWPVLRRRGVDGPGFSSIFQTSLRWNGFLAFAIAERLFPPEGAAMVALVMAIIIIPVNLITVPVVALFAGRDPNLVGILKKIASNPLILATGGGIVMHAMPFQLPAPLMQMLEFVARAALGMGLMAIGAGLRPGDALRPSAINLLGVAIKLAVYPVLVISAAMAFGVRGEELTYLALCAAVPTAMNGYVLARQMGGGAELYAAIATVQTAVSFLSIPAVLAITAQLSVG